MATKTELLAEAKELGIEFTNPVSNAQIQDAIDQAKTGAQNTVAPQSQATVAPGVPFDGTPAPELLTAVEGDENTTVTPVQPEALLQEEPEEVTPVAPAPAPAPTPAASEGSEIAKAIAQGMKEAKGDKTIKITIDKSVTPRFGVVKSKKTGEVMLRENETGVLSKVQLESLEEKEASIQGEEVESIR